MIKQDHTIQTKNSASNPRIFQVICLALASILLTGGVCEMVPRSEPIFREDLIGDYAANFDKGLIDSLRLNDDSTYVRKFMGEDSILFVDTGFWGVTYSYPADARDISVVFPAFIMRYNLSGAGLGMFSRSSIITDTIPSGVSLSVLKTRSFVRVPLRLGSRYGPAYLKVTPKEK